MADPKKPERNQAKRILRFRQHAFLLHTQYKQTEIADKLGVTKENFNKYYNDNDPAASPGLDFLKKFDEIFEEEIKLLVNHLKIYNKEDLSLVGEPPREEYVTGPLNDYIESLKDHIITLKDDKVMYKEERETYKGQIAFLQHLINRHLPDNVAEKAEEQAPENYSVKIVTPEKDTDESDPKEYFS